MMQFQEVPSFTNFAFVFDVGSSKITPPRTARSSELSIFSEKIFEPVHFLNDFSMACKDVFISRKSDCIKGTLVSNLAVLSDTFDISAFVAA